MTIPADQVLLYQELVSKIPAAEDEEGLNRYMGEVMRVLLRRAGDAEFREAISAAYVEGSAGRPWPVRRELAKQVIGTVLEKRPEIARAWQAIHGAPTPPPPTRRREADLAPLPPPAPPPPLSPPLPAEPPYEFASCEHVVAAYLAEVLEKRIAVFQVPQPAIPSVAYCHDRPFFLFSPVFVTVVKAFAAGPLLSACRIGLERKVYRHAKPEVLSDEHARSEFLTAKRPDAWKVIIDRLTKLAAAQKNAEAKMALNAAGKGDGPGFKEVMVSETRPREFNVLGVKFSIGSVKATKKVRVKEAPPGELDETEWEAMGLIGQLHDIAREQHLDLPPGVDFQFLRTLLEFDAKRFHQNAQQLSALVGHRETTRAYLFERLAAFDKVFSNHLSDILVVMLFTEQGDKGFGFEELYEICVGTGKDTSAMDNKRPFLRAEVSRRPRELAFQLREALKRRLDDGQVITATKHLCTVFARMGRNRFAHELEAAQAVLAAFPLAFSGDPDEAQLDAIGHLLHESFALEPIDVAANVVKVGELYRKVGRKKVVV